MSTNFDKWKASLTVEDAKQLIKESSCLLCPRFQNLTCDGFTKLYRHELNQRTVENICDDRLNIYFSQETDK